MNTFRLGVAAIVLCLTILGCVWIFGWLSDEAAIEGSRQFIAAIALVVIGLSAIFAVLRSARKDMVSSPDKNTPNSGPRFD